MRITLTILLACISPSEPPITAASCAATKTCRPSIKPKPVITPSPRRDDFAAHVGFVARQHQRIDLGERAGIEQHVDAFARRQPPLGMLSIGVFGRTGCLLALVAQFIDVLFHDLAFPQKSRSLRKCNPC